jgi:16S rRNA (guanine966-N2)-methyltransferase
MRIVGGRWRGRRLVAPSGEATRPTADRVRQALFDILMHAPWAEPDAVVGVRVLDAFAGTGALGLEALSRGAAHATFVETDPAALQALRRNIKACDAEAISDVLTREVRLIPGPASPGAGEGACHLIFLDPPYRQQLIRQSLELLAARGWIGEDALIVAETARDESAPTAPILVERIYGAVRISIWRWP